VSNSLGGGFGVDGQKLYGIYVGARIYSLKKVANAENSRLLMRRPPGTMKNVRSVVRNNDAKGMPAWPPTFNPWQVPKSARCKHAKVLITKNNFSTLFCRSSIRLILVSGDALAPAKKLNTSRKNSL
jgi:hypothetical protein